MTITLYDFAAKAKGPWNPNTLKARISLNYKGLDFKTEWVEFPDVESTMKSIGAKPITKKPDGSDMYTLPTIHDSSTGKVISDSFEIAVYLDETYPDKPGLFPGESKAAIAVFNHVWSTKGIVNIFPLVHAECYGKLNAPSAKYFQETRQQWYGVKLEDCPRGAQRVEGWQKVKTDLSAISELLNRNGDKPWFFGETFSFSDAIMGGFFAFVKWSVDGSEWAEIAQWNGGRWAKVLDATIKLRA